tara:strand:- start:963 stop:1631 length:669 start_codon:yes stop_codon:yes gene_type:complete
LNTWNLKVLREKLQITHQKDDVDRAVSCMDSFDWKNKASLYHINTANEVFLNYSGKDDQDVMDMMHRILSNEVDEEFEKAKRIREFSLVAAATSVHTLPELLAQIISVTLNPEIKDVHSISFNRVIKKIKETKYKVKLESLQNSEEYKYINAFANTVKHITLVKPKYTVGFDPENYHGIVFDRFQFKGTPFKATRDEKLIEYIHAIRTFCVNLGKDLNRLVC